MRLNALWFSMNLTPFIPLSFKGEGEGFLEEGLTPLLNSHFLLSYNGEKSEGALAPSKMINPLPLVKGKGIQGIGLQNKIRWQCVIRQVSLPVFPGGGGIAGVLAIPYQLLLAVSCQ